MGQTDYKGVPLDSRTAEMMHEIERLCPNITIDATQGSFNTSVAASGGTHAGAGAIDLAAANLAQSERDELVLAMRRIGFAAWHRTPAQSDWPHHIHAIAMGEPAASMAAKDQMADFLAGRNGLASNAPDDGPRNFDYVGITWEQYLAQSTVKDEDMAAATVVFFRTTGAWYASYPNAGVYRIMPDNKTLEDLKTVVTRAGGNWTVHSDKAVENIDAFGVRID